MRRSIGFMLVLSILALGLSGCTVTAADEVMKAPSFNLSAFETWQDEMTKMTLLSPVSELGSDWSMAISEPDALKLNVFNTKTQKKATVPLDSSYFFSTATKDINNDGIEEIFINFRQDVSGPTLLVLDVNHLDQPLFRGAYTAFTLADFNGEMALYTIGNEMLDGFEESYFYRLSLEDFSVSSKIDVGFLYVPKMISGKLKDGRMGIFYSGGVGAHSAVSDCVVVNESGDLESLFYKPDVETNQPSTAYYAEVKDTNQDGVIEFPFMDPSPYQTDSSMAGTIWLTRYADYADGKFETVSVFHDTYYGALSMKPEWVADWAITRSDYQGDELWYAYTDQKSGDMLMTIHYLDDLALKTKLAEDDSLEVIGENPEFTAVAQWGDQLTEATKQEIKKAFLINPDAKLTR